LIDFILLLQKIILTGGGQKRQRNRQKCIIDNYSFQANAIIREGDGMKSFAGGNCNFLLNGLC
jgi:hypothetical protein